jgi:hypothetical protein
MHRADGPVPLLKYYAIKPFAESGFKALRSIWTLYKLNDQLQVPVALPMEYVTASNGLKLGVHRSQCARDGEVKHSWESNAVLRV